MFSGTIKALSWGILVSSLISKSAAQRSFRCDATESFYDFNSSKVMQIPALRTVTLGTSRHRVEEDGANTWYFTARTKILDRPGDDDAMTSTWLNTGTRNASDVGACLETTPTYGLRGFSFSRHILERSVNDTGDCKIMLGEECVRALEGQYTATAMAAYSTGCTLGPRDLPDACTSVVDGGSRWRGSRFESAIDLGLSYDNQTLASADCPDSSMAVNSSMHLGPGLGGRYQAAVRFPRPYILTFWPNRGISYGVSPSDVRVKLLCLRTDDIEEGSPVPDSAKDILNSDDVKYAGNATGKIDDPSSKTSPSPSPSPSPSLSPSVSTNSSPSPSPTEAAAGRKTVAPYLGAAAIAGLLLV